MKTFAHHDLNGVINSVVVVNTPDGVQGGVEPELGRLVTETDGIELSDSDENLDAVRKFLDSRRVEVGEPSRAKLIGGG